MKWTVFDFEFTELLPPSGEQWGTNLHIACASMYSTGDMWPQVWFERPPGPLTTGDNVQPGDYMSETTLVSFVAALEQRVADGYALATWGGSATDWRLLMRECPSKKESIKKMALESIDVPMCSCMSIGMMMGLNAACQALGFSLKESGASASVPDLWAVGDRQTVLRHVSNDSYATMLVIKQAEVSGRLPWITQKGQLHAWDNVQFLTVRACLGRELPSVPFSIGPNHNAKLLARWLLLC